MNDVFPAAASCASAAEHRADDAMTTSALSVSFFMYALCGFGVALRRLFVA